MSRFGWLLSMSVAAAACSGVGARNAVRDCAYCPEMVVIPAGVAIVGAATGDRFRSADETPVRTFVIREPFAMSRYEVTRAQYEAFVRATGRNVEGECLSDRTQRGNWVMESGLSFRDPGFPQKDDHPAACVSWNDAQAYVAWLNTQSDGGYRLPTEVEWEYVARAGGSQDAAYPWGNDPEQGCTSANGFDRTTIATYKGVDTSGYKTFDPLPCTDGWLNTAPVGSLAPNAFGVSDIIGNVSEWIEDCHSASHDALSATGAPPTFDGACSRRVAKGGSWGTLAHNLRTADRFPYPPEHRDDSIGIRIVRTRP